MIYFIVTTSIFNDCSIRRAQYLNGINTLKNTIINMSIENYKIIIIENNGLRHTYLDDVDCEVYYTTNNSIPKYDKGYKELQDILDCIKHFNINDNDFIVKMTGRYILTDDSEFMNIVKNISITKYDCIIKFGSFGNPVDYQMNDCITGLIGMSCYFIKQIEKPTENVPVEHKWAECTYKINIDKIHQVKRLGINICPGNNNYYFV